MLKLGLRQDTILADIQDNSVHALRERYDEIRLLLRWLSLEQLDRQVVNHQLQQYAIGDRNWMFADLGEKPLSSRTIFAPLDSAAASCVVRTGATA